MSQEQETLQSGMTAYRMALLAGSRPRAQYHGEQTIMTADAVYRF